MWVGATQGKMFEGHPKDCTQPFPACSGHRCTRRLAGRSVPLWHDSRMRAYPSTPAVPSSMPTRAKLLLKLQAKEAQKVQQQMAEQTAKCLHPLTATSIQNKHVKPYKPLRRDVFYQSPNTARRTFFPLQKQIFHLEKPVFHPLKR